MSHSCRSLTNRSTCGGTGLGTLIQKIPYSWAQAAGASCMKYGNIAADLLEKYDKFVLNGYAAGLVQLGVPPADAWNIAQFVELFLPL